MFIKILIFPIFISLACFSMNEQLLYVITDNETIKLNLSEVFIGNNIGYSTVQPDFKIIQPFDEQEKLELPEQTYPISFKPLLNINKKWRNQFAYMAENFISVNITYSDPQINLNAPQFRTILYLEKQDLTLNCFDFDYFNDDSFIIVCQKENQNIIYIHHKNGDLINTIELDNFVNVKSIQITNTLEYFYKLESNSSQSVLAIYKWNKDQNALTLESQINNQTIHFLFPSQQYISLKINKYKILNNNIIYFLDQSLGLFKYENNQATIVKIDKILSFDIDDENGFLIYLYTKKIIVYQHQHNIQTISLDINVDEKAKIHISGQYIILHNTGYFQSFSIYSGYQLQRINSEGIITYLTSQHYLLTLSNEYSHFYLLNHGYLLLNTDNIEKTNLYQFVIQGKDNHGSCNTSITLQSIQENQEILISDNENQSITIGSPFHQQELYLRISGPNQNYKCIQNCQIQQIINYPNNIQLKDQLIYQDILKIDNKNYYLVQQFKNSNEFNIDKCELQAQFICTSYSTIQIQINLNQDNFQSQLIDKIPYFLILKNQQTISFQNNNTIIKQFLLEKSLKQFLFDQSSLYLIFDNQIHYYPNILISNDYILVDQSFFKKFSYNLNLSPQKLYINLKRDTLLINNQNSLLITNLFNDFYIKYYLNLEIKENDFIALSDQTFILIKDNILFEYNYYQEIYLIHKLPTYQQQLFQPLNAKQINNYLLIQNEQQEILIYKFNTQSHNSLKLQISITNILNSNDQKQKILIAPFIQDQNLFLMLYSNELKLKKIHLNPIVQYQFQYQDNKYIQEMEAFIKVYNNKQTLDIHQSIKQINTFTSISLLEKELKEENKLYLQKYQQKIPMVHKWYEGQVIDFIAESEIKDVVTIQNLIEKIDGQLSNRFQFNNLLSLNNETKLLQGAQSFILFNQQLQLSSFINLDVKPQYTCISTIQDQLFFYTLCNSVTDSQLHITKVDDGFPLGFLYQFEGFTKKIGSINKKIVYLMGNILKIGDIIFENGQFNIKNIIQINENYLKLKILFHAVDFDITQNEGDEYIIQILDSSGVVAVLRGIYKENNYVVFNIKTFDTKELIKKNNYSILSDTSFIFIKNLFHSKNFISNLSFLILTNNAGSYGIRIIYDDDSNPFLDFIIVQYGFWETQRFDIGNNIISISYKNDNNKVLIGVYKINFNQQQIQFEQFKIKSGLQIDQIQQDPIFFYLNDNYLIVDTQNEILQEYQINDYVYFLVKGAQDRQHINITAKNDFTENTLNYIINYHIEEELSNTWWIVLVSVCGGAILIAFFFYLYKRMHPVKSVSSILLE